MRVAGLAALTAVVAATLCVLAPLRQLSGDTVPGRIGGAVLRCAGDFDLAHVDWVRVETDRDREFYYSQLDEAGEHSSVFGPVPAVVMWLALLDFGEGDAIADDTLRRRERGAAAVLLALATALIVLAAAARVHARRALLVGAVCALSFAGAGSLGQGLWQATTALPALMAALATLAWRDRYPRLGLVTPALLVLAVMLRPTIALLALGIGLAWAREPRDRRAWMISIAAALVVSAPLVAWNAIHLWSPLPIGQWYANTRVSDHVFSASGAAVGAAGLLVSPARGILWFAPVAIVGVASALRDRDHRLIAAGVILQLVVMGAFFKWHGGQAFGPRLLAEATWIATWLALGTALPLRRWLLVPSVIVTIFVGQLALWRFRPEQWEVPHRPEAHLEKFWSVADSPIPATFTSPPHGGAQANDSPAVLGLRCEGGGLRSLRPGES